MQFLVIQKSAAAVTAIKGTVDGVSKKVDKLIEFLDKMSPEEKKAADMVERRGGEAAVIEVSKRTRFYKTTSNSQKHYRTKNFSLGSLRKWERRLRQIQGTK